MGGGVAPPQSLTIKKSVQKAQEKGGGEEKGKGGKKKVELEEKVEEEEEEEEVEEEGGRGAGNKAGGRVSHKKKGGLMVVVPPPQPSLKFLKGGKKGGGGGGGGGAPPPIAKDFDPLKYFVTYTAKAHDRTLHWSQHLSTEDECFACRDGGELVECEYRGSHATCAKVYHGDCLDGGVPDSDEKWRCPRHECAVCMEATYLSCFYCPLSWCATHGVEALRGGKVALLPSRASAVARSLPPAPLSQWLIEQGYFKVRGGEGGGGSGGSGDGVIASASASGGGGGSKRRESVRKAATAASASTAPPPPVRAVVDEDPTVSMRTPDISSFVSLGICQQCQEQRDESVRKGALKLHPGEMPVGSGGKAGEEKEKEKEEPYLAEAANAPFSVWLAASEADGR